jgi:hypothetical protein
MRRLLTGYAGGFNRRHGRAGHLFQNRYHSLMCEEDAYLLALVRYVHLNPLRAGLVPDVHALADYPWCGHGTLVGRSHHAWQETAEVLAQFTQETESAGRAYAAFIAEGVDHDHSPGRRTEAVEREAVRGLREVAASRIPGVPSTKVSGSPEFAANLHARRKAAPARPAAECQAVVDAVCRVLGLSPKALASRRRTRPISNGRAIVVYVARTRYRISCTDLAGALGTSMPAISLAEQRGAKLIKQRVDLRVSLQKLLN